MGSSEKIILHHYSASPYSEKARLFLGFKKVSWSSVVMPSILPKPDLIPLTGGYRRAPVLQIGSDIYCDTSSILEKLHSIFPDPAISSDQNAESAELIGYLVDSEIFVKVARFVMGSYAQKLPQDLVDDRAKMHPHYPFTRENLEKDVEYLHLLLSKYLPKFGSILSSNRYFGGEVPAYADFTIYTIFWFLNTIRKMKPLTGGRENLLAWFSRMKEFGQEESSLITSEDALLISKNSEPLPISDPEVLDTGFKEGDKVLVSPEFYDHETISGILLRSTSSEIILSSENDRVGKVHIHFPRLGYGLRKS
ncbi:glutathione S-transferase [Leptospira sarikeiensis]|uniref:Glutathione S-transferase family protein n=1 Tax=Leptospira sarikeiensis TaxID=2484943 RepID=A0A4V3JSJ3_9LEPT|nr:glutathione S-transferase family protein [Leptospira sarikeiensis]TGL65777.1 glutathione S-transferase family protein [Leptospira sarikeiensis]